MDLKDHKQKLFSNKIQKLIKNYVLTLVNNKNEVNQNLKSEDLNIILSGGGGSRKSIFSSLSIINRKFDPKTYSKKNFAKFEELKGLIDPLDEEGIYPNKFFENIEINLIPKLTERLIFDLSGFDLRSYKEQEEIKKFDINSFENQEDKRSTFYIYTMKLNGNRHKFKKIIEFCETTVESEKFFKIFKKIIIIFEIKSLDELEDEFNKLPLELRDINDNENFRDYKILFNIKNEEENSVSDIFVNSNNGKTLYFILDSEHYIKKINTFYNLNSIINEIMEQYNQGSEIAKDKNEILVKKIDAFYKFFDFLSNIKEAKYNFYISYYFELVLIYNQIEDKLLINDVDLNRFFGEFRPKEHKKLKEITSILKPEHLELNEIESIDIDIDFDDMTCIKCSKKIKDNEELFYCYICKHKYCYTCVKNHLRNNNGKKKFIDQQHNLLFFKTRDKKNLCGIDKYKLGKNTFADVDKSSLGRFTNAQCNGCANQFTTSARYICISCKPGLRKYDGYNDYCQKCIEHMMENDKKGQDLQKITDNVYNRDCNLLDGEKAKMRHDHNSHIYLMIALANNNEENPYTDY